MTVVNVRPGETVTVVGLPQYTPGLKPEHPIYYPPGPVDPGYSPPWAQVPGTPPGPVDPGYSPPWAQVRPPVDPGYSPPWAQVRPPVDPGYSPPWAQVPDVPVEPEHPWVPPTPPTGPVDPGYSPPWAQVPDAPDGGGGVWVWAWSPKPPPNGRWMYVRVPGAGEASPKK